MKRLNVIDDFIEHSSFPGGFVTPGDQILQAFHFHSYLFPPRLCTIKRYVGRKTIILRKKTNKIAFSSRKNGIFLFFCFWFCFFNLLVLLSCDYRWLGHVEPSHEYSWQLHLLTCLRNWFSFQLWSPLGPLPLLQLYSFCLCIPLHQHTEYTRKLKFLSSIIVL